MQPCIHSGPLTICGDANLGLASISAAATTIAIASTELGGCAVLAGNSSWELGAGVLSGKKTLRCAPSEFHAHDGVEAVVIDTLWVLPGVDDTAIGWNVTVTSAAAFHWTVPIISSFSFPSYADDSSRIWQGGVLSGSPLSAAYDPLAPFKLGDACRAGGCELPYGGEYARVQRGIPKEVWSPALALPVFTALAHDTSSGLAVIQSPETIPVGASLTAMLANGAAQLNYSRNYHRLAVMRFLPSSHNACCAPRTAGGLR